MRSELLVLGFLIPICGSATAQVPSATNATICLVNLPPGTLQDTTAVSRVEAMLKRCKALQQLEASGFPFSPAEPSTAYYWQDWMCAKNAPGEPARPMASQARDNGSVSLSCLVSPSVAGP